MEPKLQDCMTIERTTFTDNSTIGEIRFDGDFFCYCLELSCRKENTHGHMAIPMGKYEIKMTNSPKFGYDTPEIIDVPGRTGIRIHSANKPEELEGCIAPGTRKDVDIVYDSRTAVNLIVTEIKKRLVRGPLYVSVIGGGRNV